MTIEKLLEESYTIRSSITLKKIGYLSQYEYLNQDAFDSWLYKAKRFLAKEFSRDIVVAEFNNAIQEYKMYSGIRNDKSRINPLIAILESCKTIPDIIELPKIAKQEATIQVHNTLSNNQSQNQTLSIFIEAIRNELTGRQLQELKELQSNESSSPEALRTKLTEKLKSFGADVASNIVANILSNPSLLNLI